MQTRVAAGIVLYNPDIERLRKNLMSISNQVEKIFLVDNASDNLIEIKELLKQFSDWDLIVNEENKGIAEALNQLFKSAEASGFQWMLTLDDDSVCDKNMVSSLCKCIHKEQIGIICPLAEDDKMQRKRNSSKICVEEIADCITAGSLTKIAAWREVGGFDSRMFIDFVDIEFCLRLRIKGYKILRVNNVCVHQQYGNITGSFSILGKKFYLFGYSPVRVYYSVRNQIYYMKKHWKNINVGKQLLYLFGYIGKRLIFEKNRVKSFAAVCRGVKDGVRM